VDGYCGVGNFGGQCNWEQKLQSVELVPLAWSKGVHVEKKLNSREFKISFLSPFSFTLYWTPFFKIELPADFFWSCHARAHVEKLFVKNICQTNVITGL
jgi:hypothetical protein